MNSPLQAPSHDRDRDETQQYITFKLADYLFALPSEAILRIVATPPPSQGGMVSMGLVQLEQYSIQIIDLIRLLNLKGQDIAGAIKKPNNALSPAEVAEVTEPSASKNPPFLIVLQDSDQALWGIAVDQPPDLMDVPHYALKSVPDEKRLTRAFRWISHVVTYDWRGDRHTMLLLDMAILLPSKPSEPTSEPPLFPEIKTLTTRGNSLIRETEMYA
jgi:purine-binding chemotaxis protein CheW